MLLLADPRFANIQSDPRYRLPSKRNTTVKLDKRFARVLHDEDFSKNAAVDRYGRKLKRDDTKKQLERFYRLEEDEKDESDEEGQKKKKKEEEKKKRKEKKDKKTAKKEESEREIESESSRSSSPSVQSEDDEEVAEESGDDDRIVQRELAKANKRSLDPSYDPARGGGFSESSSSESSSDEDSEEEEEDEVEELEYHQRTGIPLGEVTNRIAVVNLDWDNIRAEDLMVALSSFAPGGKGIEKVTVYPSEFGKERMEREAIEGPPKELFADKHKKKDNDSDSDSDSSDSDDDEKIKEQLLQEDEGKEFDDARLRKYQLERLRYYYAVLTCSSKEVAKHIYDSVDGTEYEASANFFDLRFIPDETSFDDDVPRDECERIPDGYRPSEFVTDALQHSRVKLTWDADDTARKEAQARAFTGGRKEIDDNDLKAYLGSDSSSDEEEEDEMVEVVDEKTGERKKVSKKEEARRRMRALLGLSESPAKKDKDAKPVGEMEVTFSAGLSSNRKPGSVFENEPEKEETTMERYIRKERERKARRKAKLKAARHGEPLPEGSDKEDGGVAADSAPDEAEDLGFDDPFFTAPEHDAKATAAMRKEEKRKKREEREADERAAAAKRAELELLMMDDQAVTGGKAVAADGGAHIKHFDMKEVERAEKQAAKKGKKRSKFNKAREADTSLVPDDFSVNVQDPRFAGLFESHEFAIDPSNPKFKGTEGMKKFLEEGRKRRRGDADSGNADVKKEDDGKKKRKMDDLGIQGDTEDLDKLVQRVKSKTKKSN